MKKTTILCAGICAAAVIGGAYMLSGSALSQQQSTEQAAARQSANAVYCEQVNTQFDALYQQEQLALTRYADADVSRIDVAEATEIFLTPIQTAVDALGALDAPEDFAKAQEKFTAAANNFDALTAVFVPLVEAGADAPTLAKAAQEHSTTILNGMTQLQSALHRYEDAGGNVSDSFRKLSDDLDSVGDQLLQSWLGIK